MTQIIPGDLTNRKDIKRFVNFPFQLYKGCDQWVPPLFHSLVDDFHSGKHPFFQHGEIQLFLAEQNNRVVGRIAVMNNHHYNEYLKTSTSFFGFFDSINDTKVSNALFNAAFEWSRKRNLTKIIGPRGLISTDNTGVLVDGFEHRAAMGLSYNYPYYDDLVKGSGFTRSLTTCQGMLKPIRNCLKDCSGSPPGSKKERGMKSSIFRI